MKLSCSSARFAILTACLDNTSLNCSQKTQIQIQCVEIKLKKNGKRERNVPWTYPLIYVFGQVQRVRFLCIQRVLRFQTYSFNNLRLIQNKELCFCSADCKEHLFFKDPKKSLYLITWNNLVMKHVFQLHGYKLKSLYFLLFKFNRHA